MTRKRRSKISLLLALFGVVVCFGSLWSQPATENVVLVIIDGVRYSEGLGDPAARYMPKLRALAQEGVILTEFYNDFLTTTRRALPAIWCGSRVAVRDTFDALGLSTQYTLLPTVFEYFRKHRQAARQDCQYVLTAVSSLWLPSFYREYGPDYWPKFTSQGDEDAEVLENARRLLKSDRPKFLLVYFPNVDHAGHSGVWSEYVGKIRTADSLTAELWKTLQADTHYASRTAMVVTNDHGRHDDQHGGFSGHGDNCNGCQHIMLLALGPDFPQGIQSSVRRTIIDITPTIGALLKFPTPYAEGKVMAELWRPATRVGATAIVPYSFALAVHPNPFREHLMVEIAANQLANLSMRLMNVLGQEIFQQHLTLDHNDKHRFVLRLPAHGAAGIYFLIIQSDREILARRKLLWVK